MLHKFFGKTKYLVSINKCVMIDNNLNICNNIYNLSYELDLNLQIPMHFLLSSLTGNHWRRLLLTEDPEIGEIILKIVTINHHQGSDRYFTLSTSGELIREARLETSLVFPSR